MRADRPPADDADEQADRFLITEGLDLLTAYRLIQSEAARKAVRILVASIVEAEEAARTIAAAREQ